MFYEVKLIAGEGSYQKNKDLTGGIGHLIIEQSTITALIFTALIFHDLTTWSVFTI